MADITKLQRLKKEIIEYQKWAKSTRERNKMIRLGYIDGKVEHYFDKSGDLIEAFVKECFPSLTKLNHKDPSGFDFQSGLCSLCEIKGNRAAENNGNIFLELTQNKRTGSKNNLMTAQLKDKWDYQFMTVDTSEDNFGYFYLMDWKKAQADYRKLTATTNGGHNAYGVKVKPIHVLAEGNLFDLMINKETK